MDQEIEIPEDGTLPPISVALNKFKSSNTIIIKVPDFMRSPPEHPPTFIQLATADRSLPGVNFDGNKILDKSFPGLSKVTLLEDSPSKTESPPPKEFIPVRNIKPVREIHSNVGSRSRPHYYKPRLERNHKPHPNEISPWVPGNEPYISHGNKYSLSTIPLVGENTPRNVIEYNGIGNRPISVPNRDSLPLQLEFANSHGLPSKYPNNSSGLSSDHPHNPGSFIKGPSPKYPGVYNDCPPTYPSQHGLLGNCPNNFNDPSGNPFGRHQDQLRDVGNGYRNNNTRGGTNLNRFHQRKRGRNDYRGRGYTHSWSKDQGSNSHNTARGQNWHENQQQTKTTSAWKNTNFQGRFNSRGRHHRRPSRN